MVKLVCFPLTHDMLTVLRYKELMKDYEIVSINSFKEDSFIEKLEPLYPECKISADIDETLEGTDTLLLLDNAEGYTWNKYQEMLKAAQTSDKKVIMSAKLYEEMNVENSVNTEKLSGTLPTKEWSQPDNLRTIIPPVIAVAGMGENCSKFETSLLTLKVLKERGYTVTFLSSNSLAALFGGYTYPEYLYSDNLSMEQKIWRLNQDIAEYTEQKEADVILAELPGGVMQLGEKEKNHFSESAMAVANTLKIDAGILNVYVPFYKNTGQFDYLKDYCDYKYEIPVEKICMARQKVEYDSARNEYVFMYLDDVAYDKMYQKYCDEDIIRLTEQEQAEQAVVEVIKLLEGNPEFI